MPSTGLAASAALRLDTLPGLPGRISATVTLESWRELPVRDAAVTIARLDGPLSKVSTHTDTSGVARFEGLGTGRHELLVRAIGFARRVDTVSLAREHGLKIVVPMTIAHQAVTACGS